MACYRGWIGTFGRNKVSLTLANSYQSQHLSFCPLGFERSLILLQFSHYYCKQTVCNVIGRFLRHCVTTVLVSCLHLGVFGH